ncbi:hypothetical protein HY570_03220, partial [Candidatus Micrarchaeota archaeon]|nr:hypothetical protein [Candidatus Micrarchaeota archaeon]
SYLTVLLLLVPLLYAAPINICGYLYSNENCTTSVKNFSVATSNGTFTVIEVDSKLTFVIKDDKFVNDSGTILYALKEFHFKEKYPSQTEISDLKKLILSFNNSRDILTPYGLAETLCKRFTGLDRITCVDGKYCTYSCDKLTCPAGDAECCTISFACMSTPLCRDGVLKGGEPFRTAIAPYGPAINKLDYFVNKALSNLQTLNSTTPDRITDVNVVSLLDETLNSSNTIKSTATTLALSTLFYRNNCPNCIGFCPQPVYNTTALDLAASTLVNLKARAAPIPNIALTSEKLRNETLARINYNMTSTARVAYQEKLDLIGSKQNQVKNKTNEVLALIKDQPLEIKVKAMDSKIEAIFTSLNETKFSETDTLITEFYTIASDIEARLASNVTKPYTTLIALQKNATYTIIEAEWVLEPTDTSLIQELNETKNEKAVLDKNSTPPVDPKKIDELNNGYLNIIAKAESILQKKSGQKQLHPSSYLAAGTKLTVDAALSTLSQVTPLSYSQRQQVVQLTPAVVLSLLDLGIIVSVFIISIGLFVRYRKFLFRKLFIGAWTLLFLGLFFVLVLSSALIYMGASSTIQTSSFTDFMGDVNSYKDVIVFSDVSDTAHANLVTTCANNLSQKLTQKKKTVLNYSISDSSCTTPECWASTLCKTNKLNSTTDEECISKAQSNIMFYLKYGPTENSRFYSVGIKNGLIEGNEQYLSRCTIAGLVENN